MMRRNVVLFAFVVFAMLWIAACRPIAPRAATPAPANDGAGIANPASVNCEEKGGTLQIRKDASGGEVGYCVFADGSECEEWAYMRGECEPGQAPQSTPSVIGMPNPAAVFCTERGGTEETRKDANGGEYGVCVFPSGAECDEWAFFRGDCSPDSPTTDANMVNPASAYCVDQGGESQIVSEAAGEVGYCVFSDGSKCEEWAYYRKECAPGNTTPTANMANPASVYCTENGGTSEIRQEAAGEVGYCVFANGNECEEWAYFRGTCQP